MELVGERDLEFFFLVVVFQYGRVVAVALAGPPCPILLQLQFQPGDKEMMI